MSDWNALKNVLMQRIGMFQGMSPNSVSVQRASTEDMSQFPNNVAITRGNTISVLNPGLFDNSNALLHELVHTWQNSRNSGFTYPSHASLQPGWTYIDDYEYGGTNGLEKLRRAGKTIANLTAEQQAELVKDYKTQTDMYMRLAQQGKLSPNDVAEYERIKGAYEPFIQQMKNVPMAGEKINTIPPSPAVPGPPSGNLTGIFNAPNSLGGGSEIIKSLQKAKR